MVFTIAGHSALPNSSADGRYPAGKRRSARPAELLCRSTRNLDGHVNGLRSDFKLRRWMRLATSPQPSQSPGFGPWLCRAFWDEDAQKLLLFGQNQVLVGYLFTDSVNLTGLSEASYSRSREESNASLGSCQHRQTVYFWPVGADRSGLNYLALSAGNASARCPYSVIVIHGG